jgi:hypothetical protein
MGAVSGDENTGSFHVATPADLTSRPTAALKSGDLAYIVSKVGTSEGPRYFLDKTSSASIDGVGIIATDSGVGRWLSEALYGSSAVAALRTKIAASFEAIWQAPTAPGTYTEMATIPGGFVPNTPFVKVRIAASFTRGDEGAGNANMTVRARLSGVGIICAFKVGTVGAGSCVGGAAESIVGVPVNTALPDLILEWTSDTEDTSWALLGGGASQMASVVLEETNLVL